MLNFKNNPSNAAIWGSIRLRPLSFPLNYEEVKFMDFSKESDANQNVNPGLYMQADNKREVMPEESMSTIMENMGLGVQLRALNKANLNTNTAMLEDYNRKPKVYDYRMEDFYFKAQNQKFMIFTDAANENGQGKKDPKKAIIDEFSKLNANEE